MTESTIHTVFLLLVFLVQLSLIQGTEIYISTPDTRDYTMLSSYGISATDRVLIFQVKACNNAYVGLMSGNTETEPLYEIDFGGYSNTVSFIRAGKSNTLPRLDEIDGPVLQCNEYKDFMITWNDTSISVSHGLDDSFLTWTCQTTLWPIQNIGISTAFGATGVWLFYKKGTEIYISTPDTRDYTILSKYGISATDRLLTFQVKACSNAYVGLMSGNTETEPLYEIDFGGYSNTVSFIRAGKSNTLPRLDEIDGPVLQCNEYKDFMITWNDTSISVSHGLDDSFLTWTCQTTLWPIQNIGISTARGSTGVWLFHKQELTTIESTTNLPTSKKKSEATTTSKPKSTDRQVPFDSTVLPQATSTEYLQMIKTTIQSNSAHTVAKTDTIITNSKDAATKADINQPSRLPLKHPDVSTSAMDKSKCSQSQRCICKKRISNATENQDIYITKVTDYIWLKRCVLQPLIDSGVVKVSECPYQCNCSPKGDTTTQEYDMFACVRRP